MASELRAMGTQGSRCRTQSRLGASISSSRALARKCLGRVKQRGIMGNGRPWGRIYLIYICAGPVDFIFMHPKASRLVCFVQALVLSVTLYLLMFRTCLFATLLLYFIMGVLRGRLSLILRHLLRQANYYYHRIVGFLRLRNSLINND